MGSNNLQCKINYNDFEIELTILKIEELYPHEEIDEKILNEMLKETEEKGILYHPIIVDKNSLIILDGMHRFFLLKELDCKFIPVTLVDYNNERIQVEKWIRKSYPKNPYTLKNKIFEIFKKYNYKILRDEESLLYDKIIQDLFVWLPLEPPTLIYLENPDINTNNSLIKSLEKIFKNEEIKIDYITEKEAVKEVKKRNTNVILFGGKRITKPEVIKVRELKKLYPAKSTRHIFPIKVFYLNIPLEILKLSENEASNKFYSIIKNKRSKILFPPFKIENTIVTEYAGIIFE
jgi:ParB-like chromosome segregation protein Spo0J